MQKEKKFFDKELELPETLYIRDIENRVFQVIVLQCLAKIPGISLVESNFFDTFLGRSQEKTIKGIYAEQDPAHHSVNIKIEINICYGEAIPEKAEEIQTAVTKEITEMTGLHVASVHVIVKNILLEDRTKYLIPLPSSAPGTEVFSLYVTDEPPLSTERSE